MLDVEADAVLALGSQLSCLHRMKAGGLSRKANPRTHAPSAPCSAKTSFRLPRWLVSIARAHRVRIFEDAICVPAQMAYEILSSRSGHAGAGATDRDLGRSFVRGVDADGARPGGPVLLLRFELSTNHTLLRKQTRLLRPVPVDDQLREQPGVRHRHPHLRGVHQRQPVRRRDTPLRLRRSLRGLRRQRQLRHGTGLRHIERSLRRRVHVQLDVQRTAVHLRHQRALLRGMPGQLGLSQRTDVQRRHVWVNDPSRAQAALW